jgi:hypothetical protein
MIWKPILEQQLVLDLNFAIHISFTLNFPHISPRVESQNEHGCRFDFRSTSQKLYASIEARQIFAALYLFAIGGGWSRVLFNL